MKKPNKRNLTIAWAGGFASIALIFGTGLHPGAVFAGVFLFAIAGGYLASKY